MRSENKGLGSGSSALFFALGGMFGAAVTILVPREGHQTRSGLKERSDVKKENTNHHSSPAPLEVATNKIDAEKEPFVAEADSVSFGIVLD